MKKKTERIPQDRYMTPIPQVKYLFNHIRWSSVKTFIEPCKGTGNIYNLIPPDITKYSCELDEGRDYLTTIFLNKVDLIVTNPPFSIAEDFLTKSLSEAHTVIYLLKTAFLASKQRYPMWQAIRPPNKVLILSARPSFTGDGRTDGQEYAWYCWDYSGVVALPEGITILKNF
jgi:hypothetical protein